MRIPKANKLYYGPFSHMESFSKKNFVLFKKHILRVALKRFSDIKYIRCKNAGLNIYIDRAGLKHSLNKRGSVAKAKSFTVLDDILRKAVLSRIEVDKRDDSKQVAYLKSRVIIDGDVWLVNIVVKSGKNNLFYYHHDLKK